MKPMDKLAKKLREDAERIDVSVSDELDRRIDASLRAVTPAQEAQRPVASKPPLFWLASTITGIAAAVAVIAVVNWQVQDEPSVSATPSNIVAAVPSIDLKAESAMLTGPLQDELDKLQSDLKKAEEKVKRDIGL